ncbi:MAG: Gfo/Idh/MocA family oxidoreductase, partial [Phycisphaeraceae bacterium]|nr:Gfo/Idh/MocA family oxidoreductase [Phycisphaeraceae bacterium]
MPAITPIRTAIVGLGRAGWGMHVPELKPRQDKFPIVAVCDVDSSRLARAAETLGTLRTYAKLDKLLADPGIDLVTIATYSPDHTAHALQALKAGKYVFVEKPIATTYADARRLKAAAAKYPGKLFLRHNRRLEPAFQHIREIIASGVLGKVYEIKLRRLGYQRRDDWQTLRKCGGGQLNNWGPHIVDHALRLLESPVADVWSDLHKVAAVGDAEDHLKIVVRGANGRIVDLEISGGAAIGEPEYLVFGSKGALSCSGNSIRLRHLDPAVKLAPRRAKAASPPMEGGFGSPDALTWIDTTIPVSPKTPCGMTAIWDFLFDSIR